MWHSWLDGRWTEIPLERNDVFDISPHNKLVPSPDGGSFAVDKLYYKSAAWLLSEE